MFANLHAPSSTNAPIAVREPAPRLTRRLGRLQQLIDEEIRATVRYWLTDPDLRLLAADAAVTLLTLCTKYPGLDWTQLERAADRLVERRLLRKTKVGYALSAAEASTFLTALKAEQDV